MSSFLDFVLMGNGLLNDMEKQVRYARSPEGLSAAEDGAYEPLAFNARTSAKLIRVPSGTVSATAYLENVLAKYDLRPNFMASLAAGRVADSLRQWAAEWLIDISYVGSRAKGTGVTGSTDLDIFISLKSNTPLYVGADLRATVPLGYEPSLAASAAERFHRHQLPGSEN